MFTKLSDRQKESKKNFINNYIGSKNAASGSLFDANSNVTTKNIATLEAELNKDINIQVNRFLVFNKIKEIFGEDTANNYLRQIENHEIYVHDETSLKPYCTSISMYPLLLNGLTGLGGESKAPKHLTSFCGSFVNLLFSVSSQFAGAVATVEFLLYFDHFARLDYGDNYLETHSKVINNELQHVVYAINQPAAARGYQSVFWNISLYDIHYYESMFGEFVFPDMTAPSWDSLNKLQKYFMKWFNKEREKAVLTFPVVTAAMLTKEQKVYDNNFAEFCAEELSEGNSFFIYQSDSADSLASCCFDGEELIIVNNNQIKIKDFVNNINDSLNDNGFKIDGNYIIKSLNPLTKELEDVKITGILKKINKSNKMIKINIDGNSISVTPDHIFLVYDKKTNKELEIDAETISLDYNRYMLPLIV